MFIICADVHIVDADGRKNDRNLMFLRQISNAVKRVEEVEIAQTEETASRKSNEIGVFHQRFINFLECHIAKCHFVVVQTEILQYN